MKILLIDADSKIPNLALMKLSTFHKSMGDNVQFVKLGISYYDRYNKEPHLIINIYDKVYCSVIFPGSKKYIKGNNIIFGGTGHSLKSKLPYHIESLQPDYSLYPENDTSYGFISRGCIRNCEFCFVPEKEGKITQVSNPSDIIKHKKVVFLDNNFLALPNHKDILKELAGIQIRCRFIQGLDIRLVDKENSLLLSKLNYMEDYVFAFDNWKDLSQVKAGLSLMNWRKPWKVKFYVYSTPETVGSVVKRVKYLRDNKCLPYVMRDLSCWGSKYDKFYKDLAAYCNQPYMFKKKTFSEFLETRHTNKQRIVESLGIYNRC